VAFVLSFLIGLLSRTILPALIIRPLVFAVLFFIIANLINMLVHRYLPELLERDAGPKEDIIMPGSQIDIMEDTPVVPGSIYARPDDSEETMGDISALASAPSGSRIREGPTNTAPAYTAPLNLGGMDQSEQSGYTEQGSSSDASGSGGSFDMLADLESLAGAFTASSGEKEEAAEEFQGLDDGPFAPARSTSGNKPQKMEGDFDPKEMAQGIRTILKKEEG
jgi:hypothetical protein